MSSSEVLQNFLQQPTNNRARLIGNRIKTYYKFDEFKKMGVERIFQVLDFTDELEPEFVVTLFNELKKFYLFSIHELLLHVKTDKQEVQRLLKANSSNKKEVKHKQEQNFVKYSPKPDERYFDIMAKDVVRIDNIERILKDHTKKIESLLNRVSVLEQENLMLKMSLKQSDVVNGKSSTPSSVRQAANNVELSQSCIRNKQKSVDNAKEKGIDSCFSSRQSSISSLYNNKSSIQSSFSSTYNNESSNKNNVSSMFNNVPNIHNKTSSVYNNVSSTCNKNSASQSQMSPLRTPNIAQSSNHGSPNTAGDSCTNATSVYEACKVGDFDAVETSLLQNKNLISHIDPYNNGKTLLHIASENGHKDIVNLIISRGGNLNEKDYDHKTPLMYASENNHNGIFALLVQKGANIHERDHDGSTFLHRAVLHNNPEACKVLLNNGLKPSDKNDFGKSPLHYAVEQNSHDIALLLLNAGAKVDDRDGLLKTPLHIVTEKGFVNIYDTLISNGADVNSKDSLGNTPLHYAAMHNHKAICESLISHRANVNSKNTELKTPIRSAFESGNHDIFVLLLGNRPNLADIDITGETILHQASKKGDYNVVRAICAKDISLNEKDKNGWSALHHAAENGYENICDLLINKGAKIDIQTRKISYYYMERLPFIMLLSGIINQLYYASLNMVHQLICPTQVEEHLMI